jgi:guanylate kinase
MVSKKEFLEHAEICGNFYGTPKSEISKTHHTLFDIDFQGFIQIKENTQNNLLSIFLLPPSLHALQTRLEQRGDISKEIIHERMQNAILDISHSKHYEYIITNKTIEETFQAVCSIVDFKINGNKNSTHTKILQNSQSIHKLQTNNVEEYLKEAQLCTL